VYQNKGNQQREDLINEFGGEAFFHGNGVPDGLDSDIDREGHGTVGPDLLRGFEAFGWRR
jgi:hypothetical protein